MSSTGKSAAQPQRTHQGRRRFSSELIAAFARQIDGVSYQDARRLRTAAFNLDARPASEHEAGIIELKTALQQAQERSELLVKRNDALEAELEDLKQGSAAIEELARSELGLIKEGETFYRIIGAAQ